MLFVFLERLKTCQTITLKKIPTSDEDCPKYLLLSQNMRTNNCDNHQYNLFFKYGTAKWKSNGMAYTQPSHTDSSQQLTQQKPLEQTD